MMKVLLITTAVFLSALHAVDALSSQINKSTIKSFYCGAGCFWAPADNLRNVQGVVATQVGYCGDDTQYPSGTITYDKVCGGRTKLVEAVKVDYDVDQLQYKDLLQLFAKVNTADWNNKRQYMGVVFTSNEEEAGIATDFLNENRGVVAQVESMSRSFYTAEKYHQDYWAKWRIRVPGFIGLLALIGYVGGDMSGTIYNVVCYSAIAYTILERRFDKSVTRIDVG